MLIIPFQSMQESSSSLDQIRAMSTSIVDDHYERRNSIDRQEKNDGRNGVAQDKKRLGSRSSSGDHLSIIPDNFSPNENHLLLLTQEVIL